MSQKTTVEVDIYNNDSKTWEENQKLIVKSHWNRGSQVHLILGEKNIIVNIRDLEEALKSCYWSRS